MLRRLGSYLSFHLEAALDSFHQLCCKPLSSFFTVLIIGLALMLPTLLWVVTDHVGQMVRDWNPAGNISLYLDMNSTDRDQDLVLEEVRLTPGVGFAYLTPASEGLTKLAQQEGMHEAVSYLPNNPLPSVIDVTLEPALDTPSKIQTLYQTLKTIRGVEQAKFDMEWVKRLHAILDFAKSAVQALMFLLSMAVILIIANTLRLSIFHRHDEIRVLKLVGATDAYILRSFLYLGLWYGFMGALIAALIVNILILSLGVAITPLTEIYQMAYPFYGISITQILLLFVFSTLLGWVAARFTVKRHLAKINPVVI